MFVWSIKTSKKELVMLLIGIIAFVAALVYVLWPTGSTASSALISQGYSLKGESGDERVEFLKQFGWEAKKQYIEVREVAIPLEFSEVYQKYNNIQKKQGFDLEGFKGKRVKRWTYEISNYPGEKKSVYANILVCDGLVIGGDVSSPALDGFMHGFSLDNASETTTTVTTEEILAPQIQ